MHACMLTYMHMVNTCTIARRASKKCFQSQHKLFLCYTFILFRYDALDQIQSVAEIIVLENASAF